MIIGGYVRVAVRAQSAIPNRWSYPDAFQHWLQSFKPGQLQRLQDSLLAQALPFYNKERDGLHAATALVPIRNNNYLNELCVTNSNGNGKTRHLVMLHGYASSLGWFYKNYYGLIRNTHNTQIHALDMLGFGLSSKPRLKFAETTPLEIELHGELEHHKHIHKALHMPKSFSIDASNWLKYSRGQRELVESVEAVYVESIEQWRAERGIEKFDLLGHSLGGYMSIAYALRYPERVNRLILASPGGVERSPYAITHPKLSLVQEGRLTGKIELQPSNSPGDYGFLGRLPTLRPAFVRLWERQWSFFSLLRLMGPWGTRAVSNYTFRRFSRNGNVETLDELSLFTEYIYNTFTTPSFSETSIMSIFAPPVMAKWPMMDRIGQLQCKTLWLYGQYDWMFNMTGQICASQLDGAEYKIIANAGHNLYFDNWHSFNDEVKQFLWK